jgi:hypothetical protein
MRAVLRPKLRLALAVSLLLALGAVGAMAPLAPAAVRSRPGSPAAKRADRRATERYLEAQYAFARAILANRARADAASSAYAARVGGECPGVMAGAPDFAALFESKTKPTPARLSEFHQYVRLTGELIGDVFDEWFSVDREAAHVAAEALRPLRWSKARITRMVRQDRVELEALVPASLSDICAQLRAWVASGYRTLPPGVAESEALDGTSSTPSTSSEAEGPSLEKLLARTEGPKQRALSKRIQRLKNRFAAALEPVGATLQQLNLKLGIKPATPNSEPASDEGVAVGGGKTHRSP